MPGSTPVGNGVAAHAVAGLPATVAVDWLDPERLGPRDVGGAVAVLEAARAVDCPHELPLTVSSLTARLRHGWDGDPAALAVTRGGHGRVSGVLELTLGHWDNPHLGYVNITVDPLERRQGLGRALFEAGVARVREAGRTLVCTDGFDLPAVSAFAKAMGLDRAAEEVKRRQDLRTLDWAALEREYAVAALAAGGYELVRVPGATPVDLLADVAQTTSAINDAPTDDLDVEDEVFTPERIRAYEAAQAAHGRRTYRLVARHRDTGVLAGHTVVAVEGERPDYGEQHDTSVLRGHRGHRLGLLLKIGMLQWLRTEEPQLRTVDTWNAASNEHMIAVNEVLGYRVVARAISWQRHLPT